MPLPKEVKSWSSPQKVPKGCINCSSLPQRGIQLTERSLEPEPDWRSVTWASSKYNETKMYVSRRPRASMKREYLLNEVTARGSEQQGGVDLKGWLRFISVLEVHNASPALVSADRRMSVGVGPVFAA